MSSFTLIPQSDRSIVIGSSGLASIVLNGTTRFSGAFGVTDVAPFVLSSQNPTPTVPGSVASVTVTQNSSSRVTVVKNFTTISCSTIYDVVGEDITVTDTITNLGTNPLNFICRAINQFMFSAACTNTMVNNNAAWWQTNLGLQSFNPSQPNNRFGCWSMVDGGKGFGFGFSTGVRLSTANVCFLDASTSSLNRSMWWIEQVLLAHNASITNTLNIRLSTNTNFFHLCDPYRTYYQTCYPSMEYTPLAGACSQSVVATAGDISGGNPQGYSIRLDQSSGISFETTVCDNVATAKGVANLLWLAAGAHTNGQDIQPDPTDFSTATLSEIPALFSHGITKGILIGDSLCPTQKLVGGVKHTITSPDTSGGSDIATQVGYLNTLLGLGFNAAYCDATGNNGPNDQIILQALRGAAGPAFYMCTEFFSSGTIPQAVVYIEMNWVSGNTYTFTNGSLLFHIQIARWLLPSCIILCKLITPNPDLAAQYAYMVSQKLSVLVNDGFGNAGQIASIFGPAISPTTGNWLYTITENQLAAASSTGLQAGRNFPIAPNTLDEESLAQAVGLLVMPAVTPPAPPDDGSYFSIDVFRRPILAEIPRRYRRHPIE